MRTYLLATLFLLIFTLPCLSNDIRHKLPFLETADKYANKSSETYNAQEARRYYFKSYMGEFHYLMSPDSCAKHFTKIAERKTLNDIHRAVVLDLKKFCTLPDEELFQIAISFESGETPYFKDSSIALDIYWHIELHLALEPFAVQKERHLFSKKIRHKIKLLKPLEDEKNYNLYLKKHAAMFLRHETNSETCVRDVQRRKKEFDHNRLEEKAYDRVIELCQMPQDALFTLANNYECGCNDVIEDKNMAESLYFYLYFAHKNEKALYRLKALGANVVTEPPTKKEMDDLARRIEELKEQVRKSNQDSPSPPE
jgi:hypothetical protein